MYNKPDFIVFSITGNSFAVVNKINPELYNKIYMLDRFKESNTEMTNEFIITVGSYEKEAAMYDPVAKFLNTGNNLKLCKGIIGSGNRNMGPEFLITANKLSREFNLPIIAGVEVSGNHKDIEKINKYLTDNMGEFKKMEKTKTPERSRKSELLKDDKFSKYSYEELNAKVSTMSNNSIDLTYEEASVRRYFLDEVNQNMFYFEDFREKLDYLLNNEYIDSELTDKYSFEFISDLRDELFAKKFRFTRLLGAKKFYAQYAMRDNSGDRILERYEERILFNALYHGDGDEELARDVAMEIINGTYQPATPTFLNAGRKRRGEMVSCFLLNMEDSMSSIGRTITNSLQLSKMGGGVGLNLSNLRAHGDPIKGVENAASGVVPVMKLFEDTFSYANQLG